MKKKLLLIAAVVAVIGFLGARKKVADAEAEAELWAEATDPVTA